MDVIILRGWSDGFEEFKRRGFRLALGLGPRRIFILGVISLSLLLIPWQIAASELIQQTIWWTGKLSLVHLILYTIGMDSALGLHRILT